MKASLDTPPDVVLDLAEANLGPMLVGLAFTAALWGVGCTQTYWYWMHFKADSFRMRYFIIGLWVIDTIDVVLSFRFFYFYAIQNFGNFPLEIMKPWEFSLEYLTSSIIMFSVQLFFVSKLWKLFIHHWGRHFLLGIVGLGAVAFGAGLGQSIRGFMEPTSPLNPAMIDKVLPDIQQVTLVVTDVLITALLSITLLLKRTGMRRTDNMIVNLVLFAVTQGILTSLLQFLAFVTYITMPSKLIWFVFRYPGLQVYVNAALASLNTRNRIRDQSFLRPYHDHQSLNTDLNQPWSTQFSSPRSEDRNSAVQSKAKSVVHVLTTTEIHGDGSSGQIQLPDIVHKHSEESLPNNF